MDILAPVRQLPAKSWSVALAHFMLESAHNFLPILYPLLIPMLGLSYTEVGVLALLTTLFGSLTQPLFGHLSDRWHPGRLVGASIIWIGLLMGLVGLARNYWLLAIIVALGALGSAAFHPAGAALAGRGVQRRRGASMSVFSAAGNLGSAASPLLVGVGLAWFGLPGTLILIPVVAGTGLLLWWRLGRRPLAGTIVHAAASPTGRRRRDSLLPLALIILFVATRSWFQGSLATYMPEWLHEQGLSLEAAGGYLSILLVAVGMGSLSGGTISDRVGRLPVVVTSLALLGPLHWLFLHSGGPLQVAAVAGMGAMVGATFPVSILMAQEALPRRPGLASSLAIGLGWMPAGLGAWISGIVADLSTLTTALTTLTFVPLVGVAAGFVLYWLQRRTGRAASEIHQG